LNLRAVIASGLICFCAGGLYGWSALILPMETAYQVTTSQTGLVFSLAIVAFTASVILTPRVLGAMPDPRHVACFGLLGAICVILAAQMRGFEAFLGWFSIGFGAASGGIYITALSVASAHARHDIATPAMVAAFGTGGAVFGPLWRILYAQGWGMDGLFVLGVGLAVSSLTALALRAQPPKMQADDPPLSPPAKTRGRATLWLTFAFGSFAGLMVLGLASKMMDVGGAATSLASVTLAGIALGNTSGRLSVAVLCSRFRPRTCIVLAMGLTLTGLCLALPGFGRAALAVGLILIATGYGIVASAIPVITRQSFGARQFPHQFALIFTAWGAAGLIAPWAGGALYDRSGSFVLPFLVAAGAALICIAMAMKLDRNLPR